MERGKDRDIEPGLAIGAQQSHCADEETATVGNPGTTPAPNLPPRLAAVEVAFARVGQRLEDAGFAVNESTESAVRGVFDELSVGGRGLHRGNGKGLRVLFFPSRAKARAWARSRRQSAHLRVALRATRVYSLARARRLRPRAAARGARPEHTGRGFRPAWDLRGAR